MYKWTLVACLAAFTQQGFAKSVLAPFIDPIDGQFDASNYLVENAYGFLPVPILITDPALEGGLGMMGLFFHESEQEQAQRKNAMLHAKDAAMHFMPPSVSVLAGGYTGNDSWFTGGGHLGFFDQGNVRYMGGLGYGDVKLNFYGFGEYRLKRPLELNTKAFGVMQNLKFKLPEQPVFVGLKQTYIRATLRPSDLPELSIPVTPDLYQIDISLPLNGEVTTSGLGLSFEFDNRDNFFSPSAGYRYTFDITRFDGAIGSDIDYNLYQLEALNYWQMNDKWHAGLKVGFEHVTADTLLPPFALPAIDLRGIPLGRYQGDYIAMSELEANYHLNPRWSVLGFAGIGRYGNAFEAIKSGQSQISQGVGIRYLIARRYGFKMGIDVAHGPEETVWYIQAGAAW